MYSRCSFGTLCINIRCSSGAVFVQFGAGSVQFWCRPVHKYLNTCTQVPISTQVSKYNAVLVQFWCSVGAVLVQFW